MGIFHGFTRMQILTNFSLIFRDFSLNLKIEILIVDFLPLIDRNIEFELENSKDND